MGHKSKSWYYIWDQLTIYSFLFFKSKYAKLSQWEHILAMPNILPKSSNLIGLKLILN